MATIGLLFNDNIIAKEVIKSIIKIATNGFKNLYKLLATIVEAKSIAIPPAFAEFEAIYNFFLNFSPKK